MQSFVERLKTSAFLRYNAISFIGSSAVAFLNYLYYPVLGRMLKPADFGEVQATISFFMQTGVFLQVLGLVAIGVMKRYPAGPERQAVLAEIERLALGIGIVLAVIMLLLSAPLQNFLHFGSPVPFLLLAVASVLGIPGAFSTAYIQAEKRFGPLSIAGLIGSSAKLVASVGLVLVGLRTVGAVLGVVVAQVISLVYSTRYAAKLGRVAPAWSLRRPNLALVRPELRYAALVLVTSLAINVLLSIDIIVVKHYFSPHDAGLYAGIATVARIIFFLTGPVAGVLIASVALGQTGLNRALLLRSLALLGALGGSALVIFCLWPSLVVGLLVGSRYLPAAHVLPMLSLAIFLLSAANLVINYHIALRHYLVMAAAVVGLVATVALLVLGHGSLDAVVLSLTQGSAVILALVALVGLRRPRAKELHGN